MKAVIFSDLHIHDYQNYSRNHDRLGNTLKVLGDIKEFCIAHNIKVVLFSGDLYDTHKVLLTRVVNKTVDAFYDFFRGNDIKFIAISGNHDQATKNLIANEAVTALTHLSSIFPRFKLIDNDSITLSDKVRVTGIPYYEYSKHFINKVENITTEVDNEYLLTHQTPKSIENSMIPYQCNPADKVFKKFTRIFNGHIHKREDLARNYTVVGSPIHRDSADEGEVKGFLVCNLEKPEKGIKFKELVGYPKFVSKYEDDITEEDSKDFIIAKPRMDRSLMVYSENLEEFNTGLKPAELLENYIQEVDKGNKDLLAIGLTFLN